MSSPGGRRIGPASRARSDLGTRTLIQLICPPLIRIGPLIVRQSLSPEIPRSNDREQDRDAIQFHRNHFNSLKPALLGITRRADVLQFEGISLLPHSRDDIGFDCRERAFQRDRIDPNAHSLERIGDMSP